MRVAAYLVAFMIPAGVAGASGDAATGCTRVGVPLSDLVVLDSFSENLKHLSLEGAPNVPAEGVAVLLACAIGEDGALKTCRSACVDLGGAAPFVRAAMKRAEAMRFAPRTRTGAPSVGIGVTIDLKIHPSDRFTAAPIDLTRGDQLVYEAEPRGQDLHRYYPVVALGRQQEVVIDVACKVREDLTVDCPHVVVTTREDEELVQAFEQSVRRIARLFRLAPQTKDGKSPVGVWFRKRIRFEMGD